MSSRGTAGSTRRTLAAYLEPKTLLMLVLGFSSGLPFLLVGNTLGYWLRDEGTSLSAIGFLSWVGIAYSLKILWAPIIDRVSAPGFGALGRRRGWMAIAQIAVGASFVAMALIGTGHGLVLLGVFALLAAFCAATQDIVIDAWRIESARDNDELGLLSSAYQFGYRIALLATDAVILVVAEHTSWAVSYALYGALMGIGLGATFLAPEPARADEVMNAKSAALPLTDPRGLYDAIAGPFIMFFKTHGVLAVLMLAAISLYRLPDFVMGPMTNPFYHDIGMTKDLVGAVRASFGLVASLAGIAIGGFAALRFGYERALIVGGILQAVSIACFALLAAPHPSFALFASIMAFDSFSTSFAGVALVSYMSSLTSLGYTATQYALLASAYVWLGKILKGLSGTVVESLSATMGLMKAYAFFFMGAGAIGVPALLLFAILIRQHNRKAAVSAG
ncbi:MAG TPA: MFS transporter [Rhizomicrobium sp.]|jgi:PAT family beta-lactamase induction signal transducer AmpG